MASSQDSAWATVDHASSGTRIGARLDSRGGINQTSMTLFGRHHRECMCTTPTPGRSAVTQRTNRGCLADGASAVSAAERERGTVSG